MSINGWCDPVRYEIFYGVSVSHGKRLFEKVNLFNKFNLLDNTSF